jgi:hypothetical protein
MHQHDISYRRAPVGWWVEHRACPPQPSISGVVWSVLIWRTWRLTERRARRERARILAHITYVADVAAEHERRRTQQ